ncbi:MAG TPA: DMT family protein [Tepidisphaeraceae bacterium]|nr:DMT family protein [Tepidisphaeraceae bacterium]
MLTIVLLLISNVFMTFAWYGHLKHKTAPLALTIVASWGIAFLEYCFMVPANRIGHGTFTAPQLKVMQEVITLVVFAVFSVLYLKEQMKWNYLVGFGFILLAVFFVFHDFGGRGKQPAAAASPSAASSASASSSLAAVARADETH